MADDNVKIGQNEIEQLLRQAQASARTSSTTPPTATVPNKPAVVKSGASNAAGPHAAAPSSSSLDRTSAIDDVQLLLAQAEKTLASIDHPENPAAAVSPFELREFAGSPASSDKATLDLLRDVELDVKIELGRTNMYLEDVLKMRKGSVVALDKLAGDPVDIYVNGRLIARGEVLVLNDNFCVRVAELVSGDDVCDAGGWSLALLDVTSDSLQDYPDNLTLPARPSFDLQCRTFFRAKILAWRASLAFAIIPPRSSAVAMKNLTRVFGMIPECTFHFTKDGMGCGSPRRS